MTDRQMDRQRHGEKQYVSRPFGRDIIIPPIPVGGGGGGAVVTNDWCIIVVAPQVSFT